jgi:hypothetical protein
MKYNLEIFTNKFDKNGDEISEVFIYESEQELNEKIATIPENTDYEVFIDKRENK